MSTHLRIIFCCLIFALISLRSYGQSSATDTTKINHLLDNLAHSTDKYTLGPRELRNAESNARQAEELSRAIGFTTGQARSWFLLSKLYYKLPVNDSVQAYAHRAGKLFHQANLPLLEAKAYLQFTTYMRFKFGSIPQAEVLCDSALHIFERLTPNSEYVADALYYKSMIYWSRRDRQRTILFCEKASAIYQACHSQHISRAYLFLGNIYGGSNGDLKGFSYTYKGLQLAERYRDSAAAFSGSATIADFYRIINNRKLWISYLEKAKSYVSYENENNRAMYVARNLADAYNSIHRYDRALKLIEEGLTRGNQKDDEYPLMYISAVDTYTLSKQYGKAEKLYPRLDAFANQPTPRWTWPLNAHLSAAGYLIATHQFDKARLHLKKVYPERNREGIALLKMNYEHLAFQVDSAQGKLTPAIKHYEQYVTLRDSVNDAQHDREVAQLQVKYETAKKDNEIGQKNKNIRSLTRQGALREDALKSRTLARNLSFAAIGLLALLLALGYNRYKLKQRSNQDLQQQQVVINDQNIALRSLLAERDWLLKEVHHRTKNNLQIVISLLNSQLVNIKDNAAYAIIRDSQYRMYSISLIHHKLYQSENPSGVDMSLYINELVKYLSDSFNVEDTVDFRLTLEGMLIDVSQAVPLGLILNEAITNALKYAFHEHHQNSIIDIRLFRSEANEIRLTIADNGKGLPQDFDPENSKSLGMRLMFGLSRQLRGSINFIDDGGLRVELDLPRSKLMKTGDDSEVSIS